MGRLFTPLLILGIAVAYFLSARLGLLLSFGNTNATPIWPPSGIALAFVLIYGYRVTPGIWLGATVANLLVFMSNGVGDFASMFLLSATIATGNTLEGIVGKFLLSKTMGKQIAFTKYQHVFSFFLVCLPAALVSSSIGVSSLYEFGIIPESATLYTWKTWFLGDVSGMVILTPVLLFLFNPDKEGQVFIRLEFLVNLVLIGGVTWYVFIHGTLTSDDDLKSYSLAPFLVWAAFRFSRLEMAALLFGVSSMVVFGTILGKGPFADTDLNHSLLELQSFTTLINICFLSLSVTIFEHKRIRKQLEENSGKLEQRVMERTQALTYKIKELERTETELAVIRQEFVKACEIAHLGHFQWDTVNDTLFWSDQVYDIFGIDKNVFEASFAGYSKCLHPLDRDRVNEVLKDAFITKAPYSMYHRIINQSNGKVRWVHSKGSVSVNSKGEVLKITGTVLDVTEFREQELKSEHLVSILENSADGIWSMTIDGEIISWNLSAATMLGSTAEEMIGRNIFKRFSEYFKVDQLSTYPERVKNGEVVTVDDVATHFKDGTRINMWVSYSPIRDMDGTISSVSVIMRDMTERKEKEDNRFKLIVDSAPNVMLLVNQAGKMEIVNSQAEKMFGYTQEELIGQPIEILLPPRFRSKHPEHRNGFFSNPHARSMGAGRDLYALHKNGSEIPVEIGLNPIETPDGMIVLAAIIDITERKKMEEARREQEVVQETVRLKDQFMANMSHEIRTPMNAIVGFTDLLDRSELKSEQRDYLSAIRSSGINLLTIINDILDLSKIHSGKIQVERTPMSVKDIVHNICEMFGQKARDKGLELRHDDSPDGALNVWGDPVRLSQIFMNLISNALKFTDKGYVEVGVRRIREDKKYENLEFWVRDSGIGIPKDKIGNVFDRFTQASSDTTRKYGGTGLGLSIVKGIIDIKKGSIEVDSREGEGSIFRFQLSFEKYVEKDQLALKLKTDINLDDRLKSVSGLHILLVEDNRLNQKLATTVLTQAGCVVDVAETGEEAVAKVQQGEFDAVLMDIQMPVMDGYRATQVIRNELQLTIPIIAMTAHAMAGERDKCLSLGMNDYLSKPFQREQLIKIIRENVKTERV